MAKKFNKGIINLEEIENVLSIESVLEHYGIRHENGRLECPLPDHFEKTGSFFLFKGDKGEELFKCHGCGVGGNALKLIMAMEEIGFHDAMKVAEQITGIELTYSKAMKHILQDSNLDKLMMWLYIEYFRKSEHWVTTEDKSTLFVDYLKSRNIPKDVAYEYGLGFAEGSNNNYDGIYEEDLIEKAIEFKVIPKFEIIEDARPLIDAGLLYNPKGTDDLVATIRNAVVFPVIVGGKIKGFIGRNIDSNNTVRYIKTTNFGLWNSDYIEEGDDIILVEGCFDALCLNMLGFNAYALLGTQAMTNEVKKVLLRASKIYILFDDERYKEEKGGTNSGGQGALNVAEELGYKAMICKPLGVKDINEALISLYNSNRSTMDEDEAFNKAKNDLYERVLDVVYGKKVKNEDGEVVYGEDDEPVRSGGAESLLDKQFNEWLEIKDEFKRIQAFEKLITTAYVQFNGDGALLEIFLTKLKGYGIKGTYFKEVLGKVKKEVVLEKAKSSVEGSNALMVNNFGQEWVDWEVIDGVLYKNIPEFKEDGSGFLQKVVSITAPKIDCIFRSMTKDEDEVQISFIDKYGKHTEIITERKNISQKYKIVDTLSKKPFDIVDNTSADIVKYLNWYENNNLSNIKEKYLTDVTGFYSKEIFIGRTGEIVTPEGLVDRNDVDVVHKNINKDISARPITKIDNEEWKELIRQVFPKLLNLNQVENSVGVVSWFLCSMYKVPIQEKCGIKEHAPLNIVGKQGSGKTTLATILQQMQGGTGDIISASSKKYTLMVNMSLSNSYAFLIDEYKIKDLGEFQNGVILNLIKTAYGSNYEQRGNGNNPMNNFLLLTPVCIIGENALTGEGSEATRDRSVIFEFSRAWKDEHEDATKKIIRELKKLDLNFFNGGYAKFILNTVNDGRFDAMYERAEERANKFADENEKITSRNITAITQLGFGIEVLKELYRIAEIQWDITDEEIEAVFTHSMQHILNEQIRDSSLDNAMNYFNMIARKEFLEDEITCDFSEGLLYVQQSKFYTLLSSHAKQGRADIPNKDGLRVLIKDDVKDKNGYIKETDKLKSIKNKNKRCLVIDIDQLEKTTGIDKSSWIGVGGETEQEMFFDGTSSRVYTSEKSRNIVIASQLAERVVNSLKRELNGDIANENGIKAEIRGIVIDRLESGKELLKEEFVKEMVARYLKQFETNKYKEDVNVIEIFKEDKIS